MTEQPEPTGEIHGLDADRTADQVTAFAEATGTALEDLRIGLATREVLVHPDTPAVVIERITSATPLVRVRRSTLVPRPDVVLVSRPAGVDPIVVRRTGPAR